MSWLTRRGWLLWAPAAVLSLVLVGCSGGDKKGTGTETGATETDDNGGETPAGEMKAVKGDGTGTITGRVTLAEGFMPGIAALDKQFQEKITQDKAHCLSEKAPPEHRTQQTWVLGPEGGVGNVVIFIKPEKKNEFFEVPQELIDKAKGETKKVDQPYCAFDPHVTVLFPKYRDPKNPSKFIETGQVFKVTNSAPIKHNTKVDHGRSPTQSKNVTLSTGEDTEVKAHPLYTAPITMDCNIHTWMQAFAWSLEHPYAAISAKDGAYKIENVPAGVKLRIVVWHESGRFLNGIDGEVIEVKKGEETKKDFQVKK